MRDDSLQSQKSKVKVKEKLNSDSSRRKGKVTNKITTELVQYNKPDRIDSTEETSQHRSKTMMQQASTNDKLPTPKQSLTESDFIHLEKLSEIGMFSGNDDSEDEMDRNTYNKPKQPLNRKEDPHRLLLAHDHTLSPTSNSKNLAKKSVYSV